eukprot:scaffold22351_cov126-Isochrysis_galbana.AAC.5
MDRGPDRTNTPGSLLLSVVRERGLLLSLHHRQPLHEVLMHNLGPLVAQSNHPRLHTHGLELRPVKIIWARVRARKEWGEQMGSARRHQGEKGSPA